MPLRSLRRGALCAPAGSPPAAPIPPGQARHHRGVCVPIGHTSGGSTNGGAGCRPRPAPDVGARPKARVPRTGGPGESGLRDPGGTERSRGPAGSVTRRLFGSFLNAQKGTRPAGRNPFDHPTARGGRGLPRPLFPGLRGAAGASPRLARAVDAVRRNPSSVTASAVTPSPLWGEGFELGDMGGSGLPLALVGLHHAGNVGSLGRGWA